MNIEKLEKDLWEAADNLRSNSRLTAAQYSMPVLGLIFLRHAYNRFLTVKTKIEPKLPKRGGKTRALVPKETEVRILSKKAVKRMGGPGDETVH